MVPNGLNPLARMMGEARRRALCAMARRHDVLILENDAGGPLAPERPPPLAALAPERMFYFTGFTKCLLPGLRYAWLVMPETLVSAAMNRHLVTNWMATALIAEIATRWIESGTARELLEWQRKALASRNALVKRILGDLPLCVEPHGLHVWMPLRGPGPRRPSSPTPAIRAWPWRPGRPSPSASRWAIAACASASAPAAKRRSAAG